MLTLTHVLDFFPPNFEEFQLFLIKHLVLQGEFWSLLYLFQGFLVTGDTGISGDFFQIALHKASQGSKAHGLQLKGGNHFI